MKTPKINKADRIWEVDVDDTLILWDRSKFKELNLKPLYIPTDSGIAELYIHEKNVNLVKKLSLVGWYIQVHSGSGFQWAEKIVKALELEPYVDEIRTKPRGRTDDKPYGDGYSYNCYRNPVTGEE